MKKGAIQLSMNFLVTLIIAIVMLGLGILFLRQIIGGATDIKEDINQQTNDQISSLLNQGQQVAVPFNTQTIRRGGVHIFGVGVVNILDPAQFFLDVGLSRAVDKNKNDLSVNTGSWVRYDKGSFTLEKNLRDVKTVRLEVPKDAVSGTYIFNVEVCYDAKGGQATCSSAQGKTRYDNVKKIIVTVP